MGFRYEAQAIEAAKRASARSATLIRLQLRRGLNGLATIASTAAWFGLFGTVLGMVNSFPGFAGDKGTLMAVIFERLSHASYLLPSVLLSRWKPCGATDTSMLKSKASKSKWRAHR